MMLHPGTKGLLNMLGADGDVDESNVDALRDSEEAFRPDPQHDPKGFALYLKRKRRAALLGAMMRQEGYDDLARMTTIREL
jgi:hypothetical protein